MGWSEDGTAGNWDGRISVALPSCQAQVLKTPEVAEFTVEELQINSRFWKHGLGSRGRSNSEALLWAWMGGLWPSQDETASAGLVRVGACVEIHGVRGFG